MRPHDLLRIATERLVTGPAPEWVSESLRLSPWVVVRRAARDGPGISVGVRGAGRHQRWAAVCQPEWIQGIVTPPELLRRTGSRAPAFCALEALRDRWKNLRLPWGPAGSVGFELATAMPVVKPESDLDIVIYSEQPIAISEAKTLCDLADDLAAPVDIRIETPVCGFSLKEYASLSPAPILLRTVTGVMLGRDPWLSSA